MNRVSVITLPRKTPWVFLLSLFLLLTHLIAPTRGYSQETCEFYFQQIHENSLELVRNRFRSGGRGILLSGAEGRVNREVARAREYLESILYKIAQEKIQEAGIHVRLNIYSSDTINAFATKGSDLPIIRKKLGIAEDGKPIYEVAVLQGMLSFFKSEDEIAFVLGHEMGHILEGHLDAEVDTLEKYTNYYISTQRHEVDADFVGIDLIKGHYNLDAAYEFLDRLMGDQSTRMSSYTWFGASHHHPSVRLALVLGKIQSLRRTSEEARISTETPIEDGVLVIKRSPRDDPYTDEPEGYIHEYHQWFQEMMAPRQETIRFSYFNFNRDEYPNLYSGDIRADVANQVFLESLEFIDSLEVDNLQKLERVFELLYFFRTKIKVKKDSRTSVSAIKYLDFTAKLSLKQSLVRYSFGSESTWTPQTLLSLFSDRIQLDSSPLEEFLTIINLHELRKIFAQLGNSSRRWYDMIFSSIRIDSDFDPLRVGTVLKKTLTLIVPDEIVERVISGLSGYQLADHLDSHENVLAALSIFSLKRSLGDDCDKPRLCQVLLDWINSNQSMLDRALIREFVQLMGQDIGTLEAGQVGTIAYRLDKLISTSTLSAGLNPMQLREYSDEIRQWFRRASPRVEGTQYQLFVETLERNLGVLFASQVRGTGANPTPQETLEEYRNLLLSRSTEDEDIEQFLQSLSREDILRFYDMLGFDALKRPQVIDVLSQRLSIPSEVIEERGVTEGLISWLLTHGWTEESLLQLIEENPNIESLFKSALDDCKASRLAQERVMRGEQFASSILMQMGPADFSGFVESNVSNNSQCSALTKLAHPHLINMPIASGPSSINPGQVRVLETLSNQQSNGISLEQWAEIYHSYVGSEGILPELIPYQLRESLTRYLLEGLESREGEDRHRFLDLNSIVRLLPAEVSSKYLTDLIVDRTQGQNLDEISRFYVQLREELNLKLDLQDLDIKLRQDLAERLRLQPGQINSFFTEEPKIDSNGALVRGMSGIVAELQKHSVTDQMDIINYITGRIESMPESVIRIGEYFRKNVDVTARFEDAIVQVRARMSRANGLTRAMILLPLFTGQSSMLGKEGGEDQLLELVLESVSQKNRSFVKKLAQGALRAEGKNRAMVFALIFSLKSENGAALSEGEILRAIVSYGYGVPGIKFAQFLAFTSDFKELLGELQDQAIPLTYLEVVQLLEKTFPDGLPDGLEVIGVKGSGSVNIGVQIFNHNTNQYEILSVPRNSIEVATVEDFRRLKEALIEVVQDAEARERFGFMLGLLDTIQASVELEFNRNQVFANQDRLSRIFNREVNGWNIKMVSAYEIYQNRVIRMEMAKGIPGRQFDLEFPEQYKEAMRSASKIMTDHLLQISESEEGFFADSDFHDGQVFIDPETNTVWLIDPGQSVEINEEEFELGRSILRILSKSLSIQSVVERLNASMLNPQKGSKFFVADELSEILQIQDKNDAFVRLIALVNNKGGSIPLPTVQWVLGINRQVALGRRINSGFDRRLWTDFVSETWSEFRNEPSIRNLRDVPNLLRSIFQ